MKLFTLPALLAAALFSAVVVVPFLPVAKTNAELFTFEAKLRSTVAGQAQLFFDDGRGFTEQASSHAAVVAANAATSVRFQLPAGRYQRLRFDPPAREGTLVLESLAIIGRDGRLIRALPLGGVQALHQIASLRERDGSLEVVIAPSAGDPQLGIPLEPPLALTPLRPELMRGLLPRALSVLVALAALLFALERLPAFGAAFSRAGRWAVARPGRGVMLVAVLAVLASAYPVVFLGKSFVSPNVGAALLYDGFPTLPGSRSAETVDVKLADIGAIMWSHVPISVMQHRALAQGELPLWNRYNSAGTPLLGQGQSMFGDPLHLGVILARGASWAWDLKYLVAKWLFATALGLLVLRLTRRLSAALIVAAAAPFIGFFLYRFNHPAIFSVCYAPWALYCWLRLTEAVNVRATAWWAAGLLVANLALMNSGTAKEAYMLLLCMNFSGACVLLASDAPWRTRLLKFAGAAWAGLLLVLLTTPLWATFLHSLGNAYTAYNAASAYQIQPTLLLGAFDEIFYRPLMSEDRVFNPSLNFLLLLGLLYFLATLRRHFAARTVIALAASSLVPLALAFGLVPPGWIMRLPFLGNIAHVDNTFTCALLILWSVLAGVGFATAAARLGTREGRGDLAVGGLLLFGLVFGWLAFGQAAHRPIEGPTFTVNQPGQTLAVSPFIRGYLAVLLAAAVLLAVVARRVLVRRALTPPLVLLGALAALVMLWRHGFHASAVGFEDYVARPTPRVDFHARSPAIQFARTETAHEPARGFGFRGNVFPGWTAVYGLETVHGPDALVNPFFRELITASGVERLWDWRLYVEPAGAGDVRPFFDALNVRWYFDLQSDQGLLGRALTLRKTADLDVYESPTAWPRAFFTDRLATYGPPEEFVQRIRDGDGRPFAGAHRADIAAQPALARLPRELAGRTVIPATDYRLTENSTSFTVHANGPGVIVLSEVFWPGDFRAELDGRKVPVLRLNHAFKGISVDAAGEHRVTFRYVPRNFPRHLAFSGTGLLLLLGSLWWTTGRKTSGTVLPPGS